MGWKQWPSWLKGGVISSGIIAVIDILAVILVDFTSGGLSNIGEIIYLIQAAAIGIPLALLGIIDLQYLDNTGDRLIFFIWSLLVFFSIGSLFGWIVGKIKANKQLPN
jgi:hypothetical protein